MNLEEMGDAAFAEARAVYAARYDRAVAEMICFCACGCELPVEMLSPVVGGPVRCPACRKGRRKEHYLTPRAEDAFDFTPYEKPRASRNPRSPRTVSAEDRDEAEDYVRKGGRQTFKRLARLHARVVDRGQPLTPAQTADVLRSKAADIMAGVGARLRARRAEKRSKRTMDLARVFIPESVVDGVYAVTDDSGGLVRITIDRPFQSLYRGFVLVTLAYGEGTEAPGLQYPQPARVEHPDHRQFYRGPSAHLIARLVGDPEAARNLNEEAA